MIALWGPITFDSSVTGGESLGHEKPDEISGVIMKHSMRAGDLFAGVKKLIV